MSDAVSSALALSVYPAVSAADGRCVVRSHALHRGRPLQLLDLYDPPTDVVCVDLDTNTIFQ